MLAFTELSLDTQISYFSVTQMNYFKNFVRVKIKKW